MGAEMNESDLQEIADAKRHGMRPYVRCNGCGKRRLCSESYSGRWLCEDCADTRCACREYPVVGPDGKGSGWVCRSTRGL